MISYLDYQLEGIEYEDWPQEAKDHLTECRDANAEEEYEREHYWDFAAEECDIEEDM